MTLVYLLISADQDGHGGAVRSKDQRLDDLFRFHLEKSADLLDRFHPRRVDFFDRKRQIRIFLLSRFHDLGLLQIRRILTGAAKDDRILPGIGHDHEFVGITSPDAPESASTGRKLRPQRVKILL